MRGRGAGRQRQAAGAIGEGSLETRAGGEETVAFGNDEVDDIVAALDLAEPQAIAFELGEYGR